MTLDDAIVAFGQVASDDFDSLEFDVRDYERLVMWLTELKLARESVFSDIGLAARATSENHQLKSENAKLRNDLEDANNQAEEVCIENAKLRELAVLNWEWAHSCCGNNCKMQTNDCGYQIDRECNYEREIWYRMRELGVEP